MLLPSSPTVCVSSSLPFTSLFNNNPVNPLPIAPTKPGNTAELKSLISFFDIALLLLLLYLLSDNVLMSS